MGFDWHYQATLLNNSGHSNELENRSVFLQVTNGHKWYQQHQEKNSFGTPRIRPRVAVWAASVLPMCYAAPSAPNFTFLGSKDFHLISLNSFLANYFFWIEQNMVSNSPFNSFSMLETKELIFQSRCCATVPKSLGLKLIFVILSFRQSTIDWNLNIHLEELNLTSCFEPCTHVLFLTRL